MMHLGTLLPLYSRQCLLCEKDREQALSQSFWLFYDPMRTAVLSRGIPTQRDWEMMGWVMKSKKRVTVSYLMSGCGCF